MASTSQQDNSEAAAVPGGGTPDSPHFRLITPQVPDVAAKIRAVGAKKRRALHSFLARHSRREQLYLLEATAALQSSDILQRHDDTIIVTGP